MNEYEYSYLYIIAQDNEIPLEQSSSCQINKIKKIKKASLSNWGEHFVNILSI